MKKISMFLSAAVAILAGCAQESEYTPVESTHKLTVEVVENATKTYVEGEKIYWSESGEQLNIIYFADESTSRRQTATHQDYTLKDNKATFTADFTAIDGAVKYTFGAFYPYAYKYATSSVNLVVPQEQTPSATSYDPKADILVTAQPVVTEGLPDNIQFQLVRLVAFAQMTLEGIGEGELIEKVTVSSPAKPAGAVDFKVHEANTLENAKWYHNYEDITLDMGGRAATGNDVVWFVAVPTDLSGSSLTVTVATDKFNYSKTIDLTGKTLNLERANIAKFTITDLVKAEKPKAYKLLTDAAELTPGDQVVFCDKNYSTSSAKLLAKEADGTAIKFTDIMEVVDGPEIVTVPDNARVFTVENGALDGTLSFKAEDGYLYGMYDDVNWSNTLSVKDVKDEESSWVFTLTSSGAASLYNEKYGRYLNNYYSSKFNFAGSLNTSYKYYIYYIDGTGSESEQPAATPLATPVVTAAASGNTITATWNAVDGAKDYTVTCGENSQTVTATTATFSDLDYSTEYTVSVIANPSDAAVNAKSEAGSATATTETDPNAGAQAKTITFAFPEDFPEGVKSGNEVGTLYDGDFIITSKGTWRTDDSDGRDGFWLGTASSYNLVFDASNKGVTITKILFEAPIGYQVKLSWSENVGWTSGNCTTEWTGECNGRITFKATSSSNISKITVEYR